MILATTLERVKARLDIATATTTHDDMLRQLVSASSQAIERYLDRHLESKSRTEQYGMEPWQRLLFLRGYPVATLTSIKDDIERAFTGSAITSTDYYHDSERGIVTFDKYIPVYGPGVLQVVYSGGMAATVIRMTGVIGAVTGTMTASNVVSGGTSLGRGTIVSISSGVSIVVDVSSGQFLAGETLTDVTASGTCTLSSITVEPLVSLYPDVMMACEAQVMYLWQRRKMEGLTTLSADGSSISLEQPTTDLIPGVRGILNRHRRVVCHR